VATVSAQPSELYVTRSQAAELLQQAGQAVTAAMVRQWEREGKLHRQNKGGRRPVYLMRDVWRAEAEVRTRPVSMGGRPRGVVDNAQRVLHTDASG
jgi:hypothetical protein